MLSIRKINPMARAIGTMGVVAGLVGVVTFANLTSNTVALSPNNLSSATASLAIAAGTNCPAGDTTSIPGFNTSLVPGTASSPVNFCLDNKGNIPLNITVQSPDATDGTGINMSEVTLDFNCGGGDQTKTLDKFLVAKNIPGNPLANGSHWNCTVTATLSGSHSSSGGETLPAFTLNFVGTQ